MVVLSLKVALKTRYRSRKQYFLQFVLVVSTVFGV